MTAAFLLRNRYLGNSLHRADEGPLQQLASLFGAAEAVVRHRLEQMG